MRDRVYLVGILVGASLLLFVGRDQLPSSTLLTWGLTFGATTAAAVLLVSLYRVQLELKESRHELARKEVELSFAREVQSALFPKELPNSRGLDFSAVCIPASGISGDYYDVLDCPDGRVVIFVADVSGKGIPAAILMANLQARLRAHVETTTSLLELCQRLNETLYQVTEPAKFATAFLAQWDPEERGLEYVNAGHGAPVLTGSVRGTVLNSGGPPLGMFSGSVYSAGKVKLVPSDLLAIYSDGVTEASNSKGDEFGAERLEELILMHERDPLSEIQDRVLNEVGNWSSQRGEDDITLVLIRVNGDGQRGGGVETGLNIADKTAKSGNNDRG